MRRLGVVAIVFVVTGTACVGADASSSTISETPTATPNAPSKDNPKDRLMALADSWFETDATVVYRTTAPVPGQPTTAHLCLRQMFDDDFGEDRTDLLRRCSRQGHLRLTWDPPDRWRMDVTSPVDVYSIISTGEDALLCRDLNGGRRCRSVSSRAATRSSPFAFVFMHPDRLLRAIGASDVSMSSPSIEAEGAWDVADCFDAHGKETRVEWCYSTAGILVSVLMGSSERGWTAIEADSISEDVADDRFDVPG